MQELSYREYDEEFIAVDIETKDPFLREKGTGVYRKDGYVIGVSFSNGDISEYYPLRHPDTSAEEFTKNIQYIQTQLLHPNRKVFTNGLYDLDWLVNGEGMQYKGRIDDIQIAEPLLDEYRKSYSLDSQSKDYLNQSKFYDESVIYAVEQGWIKPGATSATAFLWKMPSHIVRKYAEEDVRLPLAIFAIQRQKLKEQGLEDIYDLEMRLFPLLLQMKKQGVNIDEPRLTKTGLQLTDLKFDIQQELNEIAGFEVNVGSGRDLEHVFNTLNIPVVYGEPTDLMYMKGLTRGNPKFDKRTLETVQHPIAKKILELKHISTLLSLFLHPYPDLLVDGKLHCQFNQLRSDEYGTVSGRFSSSNPNLQQVSAKNEQNETATDSELLNGQIIRKLFIPVDGCDWMKYDWSQIEYRLIAHYATGEGAETIRRRYNEDPNVDYHNEMGIMTGLTDRKIVKTLNFGAAYGMGIDKMAKTYGWDKDEAEYVYKNYHGKVPFVKETSRRVALKAKQVGFIRTLLNRRARLVDSSKSYVMFNRLIQGSAADIMKKAMVTSYEAGVFNSLYPHITVHDEMDVSKPRTKEGTEAAKELKHIMETCVELRVPIKADVEIGPSWGQLTKWEAPE